jgi:hypothetical protein
MVIHIYMRAVSTSTGPKTETLEIVGVGADPLSLYLC